MIIKCSKDCILNQRNGCNHSDSTKNCKIVWDMYNEVNHLKSLIAELYKDKLKDIKCSLCDCPIYVEPKEMYNYDEILKNKNDGKFICNKCDNDFKRLRG